MPSPNRFNTQFERCRTAIDRAFGISMTLKQGGLSTEEFTAVWDQRKSEIKGKEGLTTSVRTRVFQLPAASIVLGGKVSEPRPGGVLTDVNSGERYQIASVGMDPAVEDDNGNQLWIVHTNRISSG